MKPDIELAEPQPFWPGVNNLFKAGNMYFSGQPDAPSIERLAGEGITVVVNLREQSEVDDLKPFDYKQAVEDAGMRYVHIPMGRTFDATHVERLAEAIDAAEGPVLIACGSSNRVGGLWAGYLAAKHSVTLDDALRIGASAGMRSGSFAKCTEAVAEELAE
jgi:uncharacterized protein (TIGR01244 family)